MTVEILRVTRRLFHQALRRFSADKTNIPRAKSRQLRENLGDSLARAIAHALSISRISRRSPGCSINNDPIRFDPLFRPLAKHSVGSTRAERVTVSPGRLIFRSTISLRTTRTVAKIQLLKKKKEKTKETIFRVFCFVKTRALENERMKKKRYKTRIKLNAYRSEMWASDQR